MENNPQSQNVVVSDVRMPFMSMVIFMVKWALASIPAFIILVLLGAVLWGALMGVMGSIGSSTKSNGMGVPSTTKLGTSESSSTPAPEERAYLDKLQLKGIRVGESLLGKGVWAEVKNNGDRTLSKVEVTIYCLGSDGKPVFEKTYTPVLVNSFSSEKPLKPGYTQSFGVKLDDAPSDWKGKVDVKVTGVEFQK